MTTGPEGTCGERTSGPDPLIGQIIGNRYRVTERLGVGGMGTVYRAEHIALHKEVALKLVQDGANSEHALRFLREAMLTSRIDHPNVVSALDYGTLEDGTAYLVMNLVAGPTLGRVMCIDRPMCWVRAAEIAAQIVDAVAAAEAQGIVHRDLKPENVVLQSMPDGSDVVKVLDFGLAKYTRDSLAPPPVRGAQHVTRLGVVIGTPGYMAPEQGVGMRADHRADLYAIGVMLWECVAGRRLWDCDDVQQLLTTQLGTRPPLLREETGDPFIPEAFEALVAELLATRPEHRPQSAVEARDRLRALVDAGRRDSQPRMALPRASVELAPIALPPPPPTSTIYIVEALARWRAAVGQPEPQPTTENGFRAAALALDDGARSLRPEEAAAVDASAPAPAPFAEMARGIAALPRASLRLYAAVPLALALLGGVLWAMPAREPSSALGALPGRAHTAERNVKRVSGVAPAAAALAAPRANSVATSAPADARAAAPAPQVAQATPKAERSGASASGAGPASSARPRARSVARNARAASRAVAAAQPAAANATPQTAGARASSERDRASALRIKARAHWRRAEFALAAQQYRLAIKAAPGYAGAYAGLGACQLAMGDVRAAIRSYTQAIKLSPSTSGFYAARGRAYVLAGDRTRAVAEYRKAVALDPANEIASSALERLALRASR